MEYQKNKSVAKLIVGKGEELENIILDTMHTISSTVGSTLGPGGCPVLIDHQDEAMPPIVSKDGVTVYKHLGFSNSIAQVILESARGAASRTADEAGDGTSTTAILSESIVSQMLAFCKANKKFSPQKGVRLLESTFNDVIEPLIDNHAVKADIGTPEGKELLRSVARISANGDADMANAVIECFELVGDEGNVTISESSGPSKFLVERIDGFPIGSGYEDSCQRYYNMFLNDQGNQRVKLEKPMIVLNYGPINEIQVLFNLFDKVGIEIKEGRAPSSNLIVVATGFSETVLAVLGQNFTIAGNTKVFPLLAPRSQAANSQLEFLHDLASVTGTLVFDSITRPLQNVEYDDLGKAESFECSRYRSTLIGYQDEAELLARVDDLHKALEVTETILDRQLLLERIGRLTGGIARLTIQGASAGEIREKKDRADDAVCAVKGAIKHGCLPGGGWMLMKIGKTLFKPEGELSIKDDFINTVLVPALQKPVSVLLDNVGMDEEEKKVAMDKVIAYMDTDKPVVFDALELHHADPFKSGILDSVPAVKEAIRNSLSISALLGTLGAIIAFPRDHELERVEAGRTAEFKRDIQRGNQLNNEDRFGPR